MRWTAPGLLVLALSATAPALAGEQPLAPAAGGGELQAARKHFGWEAWQEPDELLKFLGTILGAIALGAVLAYHPFAGQKSSLEDLDQPKIIITYTVVGALVAIVVAAIPSMAFAIFGIGGLMRFRTELGAAKETGRVILATLLGLTLGLQFWWMAILGTVIAWVLIGVLESRKGMRMTVRGLHGETISQSAAEYGKALLALGCRFFTPRKNPGKGQVSFIIKARRSLEREAIEERCHKLVPADLRGTIDWPEE